MTGEGVTLPITAGHIHEAPEGEAGDVVLPLFPEAEAEFPIEGCVTADAGLVAEIEADPENYYVNLHNADFPAGALRGQLAVSGGGEPTTGMVMVMKHLCDASVQSEADFMAVEERSLDNPTTPMDVPSLGSTAETVLECPTIVQPGDSQTPGAIGSGSAAFDFTTEDADGTTQTLTTDTTFSGDNGFDTPVEDFACEDDIGYDADRSGDIDSDVASTSAATRSPMWWMARSRSSRPSHPREHDSAPSGCLPRRSATTPQSASHSTLMAS